MRVGVIGQKWLGRAVLEDLCASYRVSYVVCPSGEHKIAEQAGASGVPVHCYSAGIGPEFLPPEVDLLVSVNSFAKVPRVLLGRARYAIGYHPSLLPLFRGREAVADAISAGASVTGGTVYHLTDEMDAGPVAFQEWCFIQRGEDAAGLWRRSLAPMGRELIARAADHLAIHGFIPATDQFDLGEAARAS
jgi:methionyl-tRNA formyltransferase